VRLQLQAHKSQSTTASLQAHNLPHLSKREILSFSTFLSKRFTFFLEDRSSASSSQIRDRAWNNSTYKA
jgi:hypothetical protein